MLRYALLGLLAAEPRHGYDLKGAFEAMLAHAWPVNVGQVYSTLARLERDGLVRCREVIVQESLPDRRVYEITELGLKELGRWLEAPSALTSPARQEFVLKPLLQQLTGIGDGGELLWRQRQGLLEILADLDQLGDAINEPADRLAREATVLQVRALLEWLDRFADTSDVG